MVSYLENPDSPLHIKTMADSLNDLYHVAVSPKGLLVDKAMVAKLRKARKTRDYDMIGEVMSDIFQHVASYAGGWKVRDFTHNQIGKKIGALFDMKQADSTTLANWAAQYQHDLANPAMSDALKRANELGVTKEVVRKATGDSTCPWCLERCGEWDPYDANAYGVWQRHGTCDCEIYIHYVQDDGSLGVLGESK